MNNMHNTGIQADVTIDDKKRHNATSCGDSVSLQLSV